MSCNIAAEQEGRLDRKTVVITGANTGIGKETARNLAKRGGHIVMGCRDLEKAEATIKELKSQNGMSECNFSAYKLDLASLQSVREFADQVLSNHDKIDILINNAGIMACPQWKTSDEFEMQFGVNHLGHFLLTNLLLDRIKESAPSRIVVVSSVAHKNGAINFDDLNSEKNYSPVKAYAQSKLANILFAKHLAVLLKDSQVSVFSLHPGVIHTELSRHVGESYNKFLGWVYRKLGAVILKNATQGAATTIHCATKPGIEKYSGEYFSGSAVTTPSSAARDMEAASRLWDVSRKLVGLEK